MSLMDDVNVMEAFFTARRCWHIVLEFFVLHFYVCDGYHTRTDHFYWFFHPNETGI